MLKLDNPNFHFEYTSLDQTIKELKKLDPKKASQMNESIMNELKLLKKIKLLKL